MRARTSGSVTDAIPSRRLMPNSTSSGFAASVTGGSGVSVAVPPRTVKRASRTGTASARFGSTASVAPLPRPTSK